MYCTLFSGFINLLFSSVLSIIQATLNLTDFALLLQIVSSKHAAPILINVFCHGYIDSCNGHQVVIHRSQLNPDRYDKNNNKNLFTNSINLTMSFFFTLHHVHFVLKRKVLKSEPKSEEARGLCVVISSHCFRFIRTNKQTETWHNCIFSIHQHDKNDKRYRFSVFKG